jgi:amino acid transporter
LLQGCGVPFIRAIGRWTMTALVINSTIGSGIFGLPAEVTRLVDRASPISMVIGGLVTAAIAACFAEVASQFSEPGGAYLYVRTAFGRLLVCKQDGFRCSAHARVVQQTQACLC